MCTQMETILPPPEDFICHRNNASATGFDSGWLKTRLNV